MIASVVLTLLALPSVLCIWSILSLQANKAKAATTGLPLLIRYVSPTNPLWMIFGSSIVKKCNSLGISTENFQRFYRFGWEANERHIVHQELGPAYMLVTPGGNWLCISDASIFADVLHRRTDFRRNMEQFAVLNVYGKNLSTTDDEEWQKHRKVTAITFTEKNNELVWQQSLSQARGMIAYWLQQKSVNTIVDDTKVFTLNVLAAAIFNKPYPFQGAGTKAQDDDASYQYRDSLGKILAYIIPIFICGERGLQAWWTPKSWKAAGTAISTFRAYVTGLITEEREYMGRGEQKNSHLVAALVRACESEKNNLLASSKKTVASTRNMTLTEEEIISNLFVYAFAGNDTTAIALSHILVDLAAHPEAQEWIAEELDFYLPDEEVGVWEYAVFPKLKRCLAVMYESLRINHPLGQLAKQTGSFAQPLQIGNRTVTIPPGTSIHLSMAAMHTHPDYWGDDSLSFKPQRFITSPTTNTTTTNGSPPTSLQNESLAPDSSTNFLPWATGQRLCPGKKFSQVELVAVLAVLFRSYTVRPETLAGESLADARKRIYREGMQIEHEGTILHEIMRPKNCGVVWERR